MRSKPALISTAGVLLLSCSEVSLEGLTFACQGPNDCLAGFECVQQVCVRPNTVPDVLPDGGSPNGASSDSGTPDSGTPDSGTPDSGTPDSGTPDSGTPDSGTVPCAPGCAGGKTCIQNQCVGNTYVKTTPTTPFVDACAQPGHATVLQNTDDGVTPLLALPFPFVFYLQSYTQFWVNDNGTMGLGGTPRLYRPSYCLGNPNNALSALYVFGEDLQTRATGICYATLGTAPNRQFVATWNDTSLAPSGGGAGNMTFSIVLSENGFGIDFLYATMTDTGDTATVGLQGSTDTVYLQHSCNVGSIVTNGAVRFTP